MKLERKVYLGMGLADVKS